MVQNRSLRLTPSAASSSRGLSRPRGFRLAGSLGYNNKTSACKGAIHGLTKPRTLLEYVYTYTFMSKVSRGQNKHSLLPSIPLRKMASVSNNSDSAKKRMWSAKEEKQLLTICSGIIEIAKQLDNCITSASVSSAAHRKCLFTTSMDRYWITYKTLV